MARPKFTLGSLKFVRDLLKLMTISIGIIVVLQLNTDVSGELPYHVTIRLCFNKRTEQSITISIIRRGLQLRY